MHITIKKMKPAFVFTCVIAGTLAATIVIDEADTLHHLSKNLNNPQAGVHMLCEAVKAGLQKINGDLDLDVIKSKIELSPSDKAEVERLVKECTVKMKTAGKTAGNLSFAKITKCMALCLLS